MPVALTFFPETLWCSLYLFPLYSFLVFHSWSWILHVYETKVKMWGGFLVSVKTEKRRFWLLARMWDTDGGAINGYKPLGKCLVVPTEAECKLPQGSGGLLFIMYSIEEHKMVTQRHVAECSNTFKLEFPRWSPPAIEWINNLWHYSYNLNLHNNEKKWTSGTCNNIDESRGNYAE